MTRMVVWLLIVAVAAPGCATTQRTGAVVAPSAGVGVADSAVLAEYVQRLPLGSPIRVNFNNGKELRGTLMKATDISVIIQPRTRVPEPALDIPLKDVMRVTLDKNGGGSLARAIGIGTAVGAGAALGFILILIAAFD